MKKYLFLDIDGVLNSNEWAEYRHKNLGKFNYEGINWVRAMIDPKCVERVWKIINETGAKLVISSSWRGDPNLKKEFELVDLPTDFDVTPYLFINGEFTIRGKEIKKYLNEHEPGNYVIIDDDADMLEEQKEHFVETDFMVGLTDIDAEIAIGILNREE